MAQRLSIDIEKFTNGNQADSATDPDVPQVVAGSTVTWTYRVTNTGSLNLSNVQVNDNIIGAVTNVTNQGNGNNTLEPGEVWTFQATGLAQAGAYENLGSVAAISEIQTTVTDQDFSHYFGATPSIQVEKATNGIDADTPATGPQVFVGDTVTFTYLVTNTGTVPLSNVVLRDDNGTPGTSGDDFTPTFTGGDTDNNAQLDLTEMWRYQATRTATLGAYQNTAQVTANSTAGPQVSDTDTSNHSAIARPAPLTKRRFLASSFRNSSTMG